jgi:hypothetical protein
VNYFRNFQHTRQSKKITQWAGENSPNLVTLLYIFVFFGFQKQTALKPYEQILACNGFRRPGLPDFSWYIIPKRGKIHQMATKYTK